MQTPRQGLGAAGERLAVEHLRRRGYRILDTNWRDPVLGELDIVAQDGDCLVFVEVRTRRGDLFGSPEESMTARKQQRLVSLAQAWLQANRPDDPEPRWRIDLVAVQMDSAGRLQRLEVVQDVVEDVD
ncbi:MAG: YraN family protein [Chloroflexota bacterium]|nr:YraN family protein [Chloroflexota bacterium]